MKQQYQKGFSLIELVIVIVILGLLAATAIPRFLNVTDDAEDASVDGVAGGLSTAVSFVRSQWEVDGRRNNTVLLDGTTVSLDPRFGYPTGSSNTDAKGMTVGTCQEVFELVLQNAPRSVISGEDARKARYVVSVAEGAGGSSNTIDGELVSGLDVCLYYLASSLVLDPQTGKPTEDLADLSNLAGKGVTYNPGSGQVASFID
ncbi:type II secretion system GspH family protein [Shewanella schlegeliana]|uniref:Type II secretion system protein n=1 Tax=Shewanella schlegeliana TaxID=190308 RepID=A0ABS1T0D2_9GAMM|nr:type II secretion system protein [Shewanella schlegeliana]MBL4913011.1 type II secretion system protein [Shewanella schlegeliana]MCL1108893.1 type II secretion system GspH family protein [Shewanella schlegeliana]GIU23798.1 MSHA biogenesis protein MshB [Shewanella schlegeliana]